jgi:ribosome-associated protein
MENIKINTEFIKLDQLLKWIGIAGSGAESKMIINEGRVKVNGEIENRRGKKIRIGDIIEVENKFFIVD